MEENPTRPYPALSNIVEMAPQICKRVTDKLVVFEGGVESKRMKCYGMTPPPSSGAVVYYAGQLGCSAGSTQCPLKRQAVDQNHFKSEDTERIGTQQVPKFEQPLTPSRSLQLSRQVAAERYSCYLLVCEAVSEVVKVN